MLAYSSKRSTSCVGAYIDDTIFPCSRGDLLQCAEDNSAPDLILDAIENLPNYRFASLVEVVLHLERAAQNSVRFPISQMADSGSASIIAP